MGNGDRRHSTLWAYLINSEKNRSNIRQVNQFRMGSSHVSLMEIRSHRSTGIVHPDMKRIVLALAFAGLATGLHAQIPADQKTKGDLNCRWWAAEDPSEKLGFVIGFSTAVQLSGNKSLLDSQITEATNGEIVRGVDALCVVPENGSLPVYIVMAVFAPKSRGESDAHITLMLEAARRYYPGAAR